MNGIQIKKRFYVIVIILVGLFAGGIYYTTQDTNDTVFIEKTEDNNSSKYIANSTTDVNSTKQTSNLEKLDKDYDKVLVTEKEEKSQPKPSASVEHKKTTTKKDDSSSSEAPKDDEDKPAFYNISK